MQADTEIIEPGPPETKGQLQPLATHPMAIIDRAIQSGTDPDNLAKLMELQVGWEERRASELYTDALTGFRRDCPQIERSKAVKSDKGTVLYKYPPYEAIKKITAPLEAKYGIVTGFSVEEVEGTPIKLRVTLTVRVGSHKEQHTYTAPVSKGTRLTNPTQEYTGALTTIKRVLYCAALDIVITDEDDDAGHWPEDKINEDQVDQIKELIAEKNFATANFLAWVSELAGVKVERVEDVPAKHGPASIDTLKRRPVNGTAPKAKGGGK